MRTAHFFALVVAALAAGTTWASAQRCPDNPPGSAFQTQGIIESNGYNALNWCRYYRYWRGPYAWRRVHHRRFRHYWWRR